MNILVVAAHPDDEVLGCGATLAGHVGKNDNVKVIFMADGETSRGASDEKISSRREMASRAQKVLGVQSIIFLNFADNRMDETPFLDIVQSLEKAASGFQPQIIYTHSHCDLNIDHNITSRAVQTAFRPLNSTLSQNIYAFEIPSSTEWNAGENSFAPDTFIYAGPKNWEIKLKALECYSNELRKFPHPRSIEAINSLSKWRGANAGLERAEAFQLIRSIQLS